MKILQLCNKVPFPVIDGGTAAMHQLSQMMVNAGHQVKILSLCTHKSIAPQLENYAEYKKTFRPEYIFLDTRIKLLPAFLNLFSTKSYNVRRFDAASVHNKLTEVLLHEKPEAVILESLFVAPYISTIRKHSKTKIILRAHNVEHQVWERFYKNETGILKKNYLKILTKRLKKFELDVLSKIDGIAAISQTDCEFFKQHTQAHVEFIPFGVNEKSIESTKKFNALQHYFLGAMDWQPNKEAVSWILRHIVSQMSDQLKNITLTIAGTHMPEALFKKQSENFKVLGAIENPESFLENYSVLIAPLFSGGGLKIKVVEAMALGKLVITTPIGIEGIGAVPGVHYVHCANQQEFMNAMLECKTQPEKMEKIAQAGQEFIQREFGFSAVSSRLSKLLG